ncbi:hypothetical protein ACMA1D_19505 [Streptomyces sp. 796.1]|uniref:hypothetical protein n=1 Tax=Streptomyces sp. 796.1 TaxID=3163029 RepID=UPI0039C9DCDF
MTVREPDDARAAGRRSRHVVATLLTCAAIGAAIVHVIDPDLRVDGITVALLVVAVLPWLGELFDSIELPGGATFQYRQLADRVQVAEERTTHIEHAVDGASHAARVALVSAGSATAGETGAVIAGESVEKLAAEYGRVRATMASGSARTHRMERIFAELAATAPYVADFDVEASLGSADPGIRLAAYARLYAVPDSARLDALAAAVLYEQLAFNQYWGFQAMGVLIDEKGPDRVPIGIVRGLQARLAELPVESDRASALHQVLAKFEPPPGPRRSA